jgi:DNA-binding transcriptional MerR regulator
MIEVDFITLGDASERLDVPAPTLRHWTDQLEEFKVHYVKRNNRNERIYYNNDLKIFEFLRDLKSEHGRRTTTKDLAYMIAEKADIDGIFELRVQDEVQVPRSNKTADLLGQEDIKRLMESERVKQFMGIVINETTKNLRDSLKEEVRKEIQQEMQATNKNILDTYDRMERDLQERDKRLEERLEKRDEMLMQSLRQTMENKKGFFARLFGN